MKLEKQEITFIIANREMIIRIIDKYLEELKVAIWKEPDKDKKSELSYVADEVEGWLISVKNLKMEKDKPNKEFTGM